MALTTRDPEPSSEILRASIWDAPLMQVRSRIEDLEGSEAERTRSPVLARESASAVLARAHAQLLGASRAPAKDTVSELVDAAVALVDIVPLLWSTHVPGGSEDRLPLIAEAIERQLSAREHAVLSGELTYSITASQVEQPAVRMRHSLAELGARDRRGASDLVSVQIAAIELSTLLIRAAGNVLTYAGAGQAPEAPTPAVDRALWRVERQIEARSQSQAPAIGGDEDAVADYLAQALRACEQARLPQTGATEHDALSDTRDAWLDLASLEHVLVRALDAMLARPTYRPAYETVAAAITETAANILYNGRLIARADAFRHEEAWRKQGTALTFAQEIYASELQGAPHRLENTQGVLLTRLVRSVVAITLIDLRDAETESGNIPPSRGV